MIKRNITPAIVIFMLVLFLYGCVFAEVFGDYPMYSCADVKLMAGSDTFENGRVICRFAFFSLISSLGKPIFPLCAIYTYIYMIFFAIFRLFRLYNK